jgi:hypothetical protein
MKPQTLNREMQTIAEERKNATFNVRQMTYFLDGGKENTKRKVFFPFPHSNTKNENKSFREEKFQSF